MKKILMICSLFAVVLLSTSCKTNKCNCPHFEKQNIENKADKI